MEIWKDVRGYEGLYEVSNRGRIRSIERRVEYFNPKYNKITSHTVAPRIKKATKKDNDYMIATLYKGNKGTQVYIHRAVAEAFIPNPEGKPTVNHIDCNRANNTLENLEWSTYKEQEKHKDLLGRRKPSNVRAITVKYIDGTETKHSSITQCAKDLGIHRDTIYNILNNEKSKKKSELNIKSILYEEAK